MSAHAYSPDRPELTPRGQAELVGALGEEGVLGVDFRLLGRLEVEAEDGALCPVPLGRQQILLAALLVHAGTVVSADRLASYVWGDAAPGQPRAALQVMVVRLRKRMGPAVAARLQTAQPGYRLVVQPGDVDLHRFEDLRLRGLDTLKSGHWRPAKELLSQALGCWRGEPLQDVPASVLAGEVIPTLCRLRLEVQRGRITAQLALGEHEHVISDLSGLVEASPFDEQLRSQLILALYRSGRRAEALEAFQAGRRALVRELGVEPGPQLLELHQAVLTDDPQLAWCETPIPAQITAASRPPGSAPPAQLLADLPDFTGRAQVAQRLEAVLVKSAEQTGSGPVVLSSIEGTGGIGKTSLAVHVAHRVLRYFPDGQLQADLHGAGGSALDPSELLARFLRGLGIPAEKIPADPEERAALYRTTLAGRRVLVLLDNVKDTAQVRPLLPGSGSCAVLITSRSALPGLDGAARLTLGVLDPDEALTLFTRIVGARTVTAEPEAVRAVLTICSGLPLAIRIAASRLVSRPGWEVKDLADRLGDERLRLSELTVEDRAVRASFEVSYRDLPPAHARAFRLLGLCESPTITIPAAAVLLALPVTSTARILESLADNHLLQSPNADRYQFHDLLRVYAAECARTDEPATACDAATHRILSWYLHTSAAASRMLNPTRRHVVLDAPQQAWRPLDFTNYSQALTWCESEGSNLLAVAAQASRTGHHEIAWKLPITMWDLFHLRRQLEGGIDCYARALASARELGDLQATAWVLTNLSSAYQGAGRLTEAADCLSRALEIRRRFADEHGEASCLINLGYVQVEMGHAAQAVELLEAALEIFRRLEVPAAEAAAHNNLGEAHKHLGNLRLALHHYQEALVIHRKGSDQFHTGRALTNVAETLCLLGRLDEAAEHARQGHISNRETRNRIDEAIALDVLGQVHAAKGRHTQAAQHWHHAYMILTELGDPRAAAIDIRLHAHLTSTDTATY